MILKKIKIGKLLIALIILLAGFQLQLTAQSGKKVKWMTFTEAVEASKKEPRKIFIDIYANWCGWCKVLDNSTFSDSAIIRILNEKYYPVKINSESRDKLKFKEYEMTYAELAISLGSEPGQNLGLPTCVFLNESQDLLTRLPGYIKPDTMKPVLLYFAENHHITTKWEDYFKEYVTTKYK
ncbi:MAG: DUF255 domain-containing protein [Prevotellaceae bacterium]|jgi:thioredoxin-related protein|nr:DUF255 domain-containing protein [Prevotellaceae bacterium]